MAQKNKDNADIALSIALRGASPDAALQLVFRVEHTRTTFAQLLDAVFPEDESAQEAVEGTLDVQENPDLPDIYDLLLPVIEQHRRGLCRLNLAVGGDRPAELFDAIEEYLEPPSNIHQGMPGCFGLDFGVGPRSTEPWNMPRSRDTGRDRKSCWDGYGRVPCFTFWTSTSTDSSHRKKGIAQ